MKPGIGITLWSGAGHADPRVYVRDESVLALLRDARPEIVQIHGGPSALAAHGAEVVARLGALIPGVRVWWGVAMDWAPKQANAGGAVRTAISCAKAAEGAGAEMIVWDAEAAWKQSGTADDALAREIVTGVRAVSPITQGLTSYDVPGLHAAFAWGAWAGPGGVDVLLPQVYAGAGVPDGQLAPRGALAARLKRSWADLDAAERRGLLRAGMQRVVYAQAHHVPCAQTVTELLDVPLACLWAAPARIDSDGRMALRALCEARRRGYGGRAGEARRLVVELGAAAGPTDRVVGPRALKALGLTM